MTLRSSFSASLLLSCLRHFSLSHNNHLSLLKYKEIGQTGYTVEHHVSKYPDSLNFIRFFPLPRRGAREKRMKFRREETDEIQTTDLEI